MLLKRLQCVLALSAMFCLVLASSLFAAEPAVEARNGMVVSVSPEASDAGVEILRKGGNAVDAAVTTAFALAVTYPQAGNIGGGGFMLVYPPKAEPKLFEYRECAPAAATADMFVNQKSTYKHNVVGVPGTVRGLALAHERFGKLPWKDLVLPAIRLADDGFVMDSSLARSLNEVLAKPEGFPELLRVYGKNGGKDQWQAGDRLVQPDLAKTLRLIAEKGPDAFYTGPIADQIVAEMKSGGGLVTKQDLAHYQAHERKPIHGNYRGYDISAPPLPSSGGTCLVEMLNILENFDLRKEGRYSAKTCHLMAEAMQRAYCDRARYLGDDAFVEIPARLTTKEYARELAKSIPLDRVTRSEDLAKDIPLSKESDNTTHFSIIDRDGMAVSNTYTLEHSYGSKIVVRGAGFLLNNEMSDFNWKPGVTSRYGQIGTSPNQIAPRKRMLSSMTPTIVAKDGKPLLITGSPGSRTIINTVLCVTVNVIDFDMNIRDAVDAPRMHHAWFPDELVMEGDTPLGIRKELLALGHKLGGAKQGDAHSIWIDPKTGLYYGAADKRIHGKASGY
ncbi:MAG TPA: gamma-glutamyltransferase [Gemmataceae bacterium]|nr:gamma-glutamyltransferase [Gemmataceae bacterium]